MKRKSKYPEFYAYLRLMRVGLDVDAIAKKIGIRDAETWKKGELITPKALIKHKENGWQIQVYAQNEIFMEKVLKRLLRKIRPRESAILKAIKATKPIVAISVAVYVDETQRPSFYVPKAYLKKFAEFGAYLDIDYYLVG